MDHQIKMMVVDAITNVVKNAPTRQNNYLYNTVSKERFDIWIRYVNSVLQVTSQYINMNMFFSINSQIQTILMQNIDYSIKVNHICDVLLSFAKQIIYL